MNATETTPSRFEIALEKAKRAIALRAEIPHLEAYARDVSHQLDHEAAKAANETDRATIQKQAMQLRRILLGPS
jgi:hypothetical protein